MAELVASLGYSLWLAASMAHELFITPGSQKFRECSVCCLHLSAIFSFFNFFFIECWISASKSVIVVLVYRSHCDLIIALDFRTLRSSLFIYTHAHIIPAARIVSDTLSRSGSGFGSPPFLTVTMKFAEKTA